MESKKNKLTEEPSSKLMSLLKGREFWSTVTQIKTWGKSINKMWYVTSAFLIPFAVFPLLKIVIKLCCALI